MKKVYVVFGILLASSLPVLIILGLILSTPDVNILKTCVKARMNNVDLCSSKPTYVQLEDISTELKNSILLSEDAAFYSHKGFDWHELAESIRLNLKRMKMRSERI